MIIDPVPIPERLDDDKHIRCWGCHAPMTNFFLDVIICDHCGRIFG